MSRTSNVVWGLIALVTAILAVLGAVYGPKMIREGKALVGPIVDIAKSEERLADLNTKMPFEVSTDGTVAEDRFLVFLEIRRELLPMYMQWQDIERELEQHGQEDWESAMEVLGAIQSVMGVQMKTLEAHGMSPAEFVWIEDLAYRTWLEEVEDRLTLNAVDEALRETTEADIARLAELESRYGRSKAMREFSAQLEQRLNAFENPEAPGVDGVSPETSALFWTHREELSDLDLATFSELHGVLRGGQGVNIKIDGEGSED
jgi:hypothetical protein